MPRRHNVVLVPLKIYFYCILVSILKFNGVYSKFRRTAGGWDAVWNIYVPIIVEGFIFYMKYLFKYSEVL